MDEQQLQQTQLTAIFDAVEGGDIEAAQHLATLTTDEVAEIISQSGTSDDTGADDPV